MKIIITESQYGKLISSLTGEPEKTPSKFEKFKNWLLNRKNKDIGEIILKFILSGDYEYEGIKVIPLSITIKFAINNFPFELRKERLVMNRTYHKYVYHLYFPYTGEEIQIDKRISKDIFNLLAQNHMGADDLLRLYMED